MARRIFTACIVVLVVAYPFVTAWLARQGLSELVLLAFAGLSVWRGWRTGSVSIRLAYAAMVVSLLAGAYFAEGVTVQMIPSLVFLSLTALFGYTLKHPPSLIERMVRLQFPEFEPGIAEYLRGLTGCWALLFATNAVVCAGLALWAETATWTTYTGGVVYAEMAVLALGEFFYRRHRFPDLDIPPMKDSLAVMLRHGQQVFRDLRR